MSLSSVCTINSTYVGISAILQFCHSFCRSAIPAIPAIHAIPAIWPFFLPFCHSRHSRHSCHYRHLIIPSAIPPFRHSCHSRHSHHSHHSRHYFLVNPLTLLNQKYIYICLSCSLAMPLLDTALLLYSIVHFCCGLRRSYIIVSVACLHLQFLSVHNSHNDNYIVKYISPIMYDIA